MKVVAQDMPQGWTTTATTTYSLSTYSVVAPALRVKVGQYVESPVYPGDITGSSLYTRTSQAACASNRFVVMLLVDGEWSEVATLTPTTTVQKLSVETPIPAGARAVRILYDGTNNTDIAFDDIEIQYVGNTRKVVHADFDAKNVCNVTSFNITGLDLTKRYYYVVSATNGTMTSLPSAEIEVMTDLDTLKKACFGRKSSISLRDENVVTCSTPSVSTMTTHFISLITQLMSSMLTNL